MAVKFNDDKKIVEKIKEGLKKKDGFCPCKLGKLPENKCMCKEFLEQGLGFCHCGLYEKIEL